MTKKEALEAIRRFDAMKEKDPFEEHNCKYGHMGCSYKSDGPCMNEAAAIQTGTENGEILSALRGLRI